MKYLCEINCSILLALAVCSVVPKILAGEAGTLTEEEKAAGFKLLFSGRDFSGWSQKGNWVLEAGAMFRAEKGGSISYRKKAIPDDFELRFEWKVGEGSNSGVYYRPSQYEYQILDNDKHRDGENPRTSAASLYFCMPPSHDATRPVGEWNTGRIICRGTVVQHWLNGEKVIDFDYTDPERAYEVNLLRRRGGKLEARGGYLSFQDHGDPVWYRGIKLRALSREDQLDRTPVTPAEISEKLLAKEKAKIEQIIKKRKARAKKKEKGNRGKK